MSSRARHATPITLSEAGGIRYLHFGSPWVQGAMKVSKPDFLVLEYVRQMMGWLLFLEPPKKILQLGLGAGSLARFSLKHFEQTEVTAVEISEEVIDVVGNWFELPEQTPRFRVVCDDALSFVQNSKNAASYGVIQVDLYDMHARGPTLDSLAFYRACRQALQEPGICVINLFGEHHTFAPNIARIQKAFDNRVLVLPQIEEGNRVVFAFAGPALLVGWDQLLARAQHLRAQYRLPAPDWVRQIRRISGESEVFAI